MSTNLRTTSRQGREAARMMEDAYTGNPSVGENGCLPRMSSLGDVSKTIDGSHGAAALSRVSQPGSSKGMLDTLARDRKSDLVDFIVHRVFYPVLMAQRAGPNKALIERLQDAARREIERFRNYGSVEEVLNGFQRDVSSPPAKDNYSDLRSLNLPVISDLHEDFERKARELGLDPDTLLTSPFDRPAQET